MKFKFNLKQDGIYNNHKFYVRHEKNGELLSNTLCILAEIEVEAESYEQGAQMVYEALREES